MRKLATIQRIKSIHPIENADSIECITVKGWELVAKKGEFSVDDLCCFFEIDSFLPNEPRFEFLKDLKTHQGTQGYRLRTKKLRGQISQGLAMPLSEFPELPFYIEDLDVTDALKVIKYDNQIPERKGNVRIGKVDGKFPEFLPKTDQERIQNLTAWFERYNHLEWEETLKLDGSSLTAYKIKRKFSLFDKLKKLFGIKVPDYHFGVCSRNLELKRTDNFIKQFDNNGQVTEHNQSDYWKVALKYNIENVLPIGYAVQGELIGEKIQSNHEKIDGLDFYVFDVYNIAEQRYLTPTERADMFTKELKTLKHVPILGVVKILRHCPNIPSLLERVKGESMNKGTISEGRVYKAMDGTKSFKCINNDYLLRCET